MNNTVPYREDITYQLIECEGTMPTKSVFQQKYPSERLTVDEVPTKKKEQKSQQVNMTRIISLTNIK